MLRPPSTRRRLQLVACLGAASCVCEALSLQPPVLAPSVPRVPARCSRPHAILQTDVEFESLGGEDVDHGPIGVLLLSVGAPETPDDVEVRSLPADASASGPT